MKIRKMKTSDFAGMHALWIRTGGLYIADLETEKREAEMMINMNKNSCFVAEENGEIIGTIFGIFNGRRAWIYHLAVDNQYQKQHIGSLLLKKAEEALVNQGALKIRTFIEFHNLGVFPFYQKNNYKVISDAIIMGKDFSMKSPAFDKASAGKRGELL